MGRAKGADACVEPMRPRRVGSSRKDPNGVGGVGEIIFVNNGKTNNKECFVQVGWVPSGEGRFELVTVSE